MSIKYSTLISINAVALIFLIVILVITNQIIYNSFHGLEKKTILSKLDRLFDTIDLAYVDMEKTTRDWAHWDDTWEYVKVPNRRFIDANFTSNTYFNYNMNISTVFNNDGKVLYAGYCDLTKQVVSPIPAILEPYLQGLYPEVKKLKDTDSYKGLLETPTGDLMFVIMPVLKSDVSGPKNGYLLMGRFLSEDYFASLHGFKNIQVSAVDLSKYTTYSPKMRQLLLDIRSGQKVRFAGKSTISAMDVLKDIHGKEVFWLSVSSTMEATQIEKSTRNLMLLLFVLIFMVQSYVLFQSINKNIIERVINTQEQIKNITLHPDKHGLVESTRNDELTDLSNSINLMLQSLYEAQKELIIEKEKAEESDRLKSAFLASMNHELRTPLNHIMGFSQLMMKAKSQKEITEYATHIYNSGDMLLKMIQDIFDLAIADQGLLQPKLQMVNCAEHFAKNRAYLENLLELSGKQEGIKLVFSPAPISDNLHITIDVGKVNQVLTNLFSNAIKFTNKGKIEFGFHTVSDESIQYYVRDTGIGIATEMQAVIFDFFRQLDVSNTRKHNGIGIGLAISKKATEIMKGKLTLASYEGAGSSFYLEIPCVYQDMELKKGKNEDNRGKIPDLSGRKILIIEDDKITMTIVHSMIEMTGAVIFEAGNELDALSTLEKEHAIDAVLIDVEIPTMNGYQLAGVIKDKYTSLCMLGLSSQEILEDYQSEKISCFDAFVRKPIHRDAIYLVMSKQLLNDTGIPGELI